MPSIVKVTKPTNQNATPQYDTLKHQADQIESFYNDIIKVKDYVSKSEFKKIFSVITSKEANRYISRHNNNTQIGNKEKDVGEAAKRYQSVIDMNSKTLFPEIIKPLNKYISDENISSPKKVQKVNNNNIFEDFEKQNFENVEADKFGNSDTYNWLTNADVKNRYDNPNEDKTIKKINDILNKRVDSIKDGTISKDLKSTVMKERVDKISDDLVEKLKLLKNKKHEATPESKRWKELDKKIKSLENIITLKSRNLAVNLFDSDEKEYEKEQDFERKRATVEASLGSGADFEHSDISNIASSYNKLVTQKEKALNDIRKKKGATKEQIEEAEKIYSDAVINAEKIAESLKNADKRIIEARKQVNLSLKTTRDNLESLEIPFNKTNKAIIDFIDSKEKTLNDYNKIRKQLEDRIENLDSEKDAEELEKLNDALLKTIEDISSLENDIIKAKNKHYEKISEAEEVTKKHEKAYNKFAELDSSFYGERIEAEKDRLEYLIKSTDDVKKKEYYQKQYEDLLNEALDKQESRQKTYYENMQKYGKSVADRMKQADADDDEVEKNLKEYRENVRLWLTSPKEAMKLQLKKVNTDLKRSLGPMYVIGSEVAKVGWAGIKKVYSGIRNAFSENKKELKEQGGIKGIVEKTTQFDYQKDIDALNKNQEQPTDKTIEKEPEKKGFFTKIKESLFGDGDESAVADKEMSQEQKEDEYREKVYSYQDTVVKTLTDLAGACGLLPDLKDEMEKENKNLEDLTKETKKKKEESGSGGGLLSNLLGKFGLGGGALAGVGTIAALSTLAAAGTGIQSYYAQKSGAEGAVDAAGAGGAWGIGDLFGTNDKQVAEQEKSMEKLRSMKNQGMNLTEDQKQELEKDNLANKNALKYAEEALADMDKNDEGYQRQLEYVNELKTKVADYEGKPKEESLPKTRDQVTQSIQDNSDVKDTAQQPVIVNSPSNSTVTNNNNSTNVNSEPLFSTNNNETFMGFMDYVFNFR